MAPSVGTLSAQGMSSAVPVTSAAFVLESPTPSDPKDSVRCGSFEFVPHTEASHLISAESRGNMDTTFGGVHFIIDSRGFLRLPSSNASSPRTSVPEDIAPAATLAVLSRSAGEGSRDSVGAVEEQRKRRRDSRREEGEQTATRPDSTSEDATARNRTRIAFAHLTYRARSNLKHRVICTLISIQRMAMKNPVTCSGIVGSSSKFGSSATTLGLKLRQEFIRRKEGQDPTVIRHNHTCQSHTYQQEETSTYQPKCFRNLAGRST